MLTAGPAFHYPGASDAPVRELAEAAGRACEMTSRQQGKPAHQA